MIVKVITLCGSTRFKKQFEQADKHLTRQGNIILSLGFYEKSDYEEVTKEEVEMFGTLHFKKIDMSDEIFVIDVNGYIGESTAHEIAYAKEKGIPIRYFSKELVEEPTESGLDISRILHVLTLAEKLKLELRHSWLSNGRQESVAEHTWRVSLMAVLISPYLKQKSVNMEKLLKMIIIHDLIEAEAGDVPAFDSMNNAEIKALKHQKELAAIQHLKDMLGPPVGEEIYQLFIEFEEKQTFEAKVANALDKLEAQIQHNEADISTWIEIEQDMCFLLDKHVAFDSFFNKLKNNVEQHAQVKLLEAGFNVEEIKSRAELRLQKDPTHK